MTLHVWTDSERADHIIAESEEDAWELWGEFCCDPRETDAPGYWRALPDDAPITVTLYDDHDRPYYVKKTCAEWIAEKGRTFLCSREWLI